MSAGRRIIAAILLVSPFCLIGCVERTVQINTEPEGATVLINDQDVGRSPIKVPFTFYGDYDVVVRKAGYKTIKTHSRLNAPWYETPFIDVFSECLMPFTLHDDQSMGIFTLEPAESPSRENLMESAKELKERAATQ